MVRRVWTSLVVLMLLAVPQADLLACFNCAANPENSRRLEPVTHLEDECALQDGFELQAGSSNKDDLIHIHFCTLHSTFLVLSKPIMIQRMDLRIGVSIFQHGWDEFLGNSLFRPPQLI